MRKNNLMAWFKDVYLDIIVLLVVALFAFYGNTVLEVVLWVYTGLLLLSRILTFFMPSLQRKANSTQAPTLFYHVIYAATVALLIYSAHYYLGGAWGIIWIVSAVSSFSKNKKKK